MKTDHEQLLELHPLTMHHIDMNVYASLADALRVEIERKNK